MPLRVAIAWRARSVTVAPSKALRMACSFWTTSLHGAGTWARSVRVFAKRRQSVLVYFPSSIFWWSVGCVGVSEGEGVPVALKNISEKSIRGPWKEGVILTGACAWQIASCSHKAQKYMNVCHTCLRCMQAHKHAIYKVPWISKRTNNCRHQARILFALPHPPIPPLHIPLSLE